MMTVTSNQDRQDVLEVLSAEPRTLHQIAYQLGMDEFTAARHLRHLEKTGDAEMHRKHSVCTYVKSVGMEDQPTPPPGVA